MDPGTYQKGILAKLDASVLGTGVGISADFTKTFDGCGNRTKTVHEGEISESLVDFQTSQSLEETYGPNSYGTDADNPYIEPHANGVSLVNPSKVLKFQLGGFVGATFGQTF